jgi:hypothetical protein
MALLAQNPRNGIHNIGLAAAIGANDASKPAAAEGDLRLFAKRFEAYQFDFAQFKQDFPFGRDVFRLTGKVCFATKSLKGRLAVAQPPGATMAVRENKLACVALDVKAQPHSSQLFAHKLNGSLPGFRPQNSQNGTGEIGILDFAR